MSSFLPSKNDPCKVFPLSMCISICIITDLGGITPASQSTPLSNGHESWLDVVKPSNSKAVRKRPQSRPSHSAEYAENSIRAVAKMQKVTEIVNPIFGYKKKIPK